MNRQESGAKRNSPAISSEFLRQIAFCQKSVMKPPDHNNTDWVRS